MSWLEERQAHLGCKGSLRSWVNTLLSQGNQGGSPSPQPSKQLTAKPQLAPEKNRCKQRDSFSFMPEVTAPRTICMSVSVSYFVIFLSSRGSFSVFPRIYICINFLGCYDTVPQTECLKTKDIDSSRVLVARSLKLRCRQG